MIPSASPMPADKSRGRAAGLRGGFTLIEILVASALFLIILGLLGSVVASISSVSSQASLKMEVSRVGREVFDAIQQDLSHMPQPPAHRSGSPNSRLLVNPSTVDSRFNNANSLFWPSMVSRDQSTGDVAVVGYFVQRFGVTNAQLRRVFIEPSASGDFRLHSSTNWIDTALASRFEAASPQMVANDKGWFADGVLALWVRCFDSAGNVISTSGNGTSSGYQFDSSAGFRTGSAANERRFSTPGAMPSAIEIGLLCISPRELSKLQALPAATVSLPENFAADMQASLTAFQTSNPGVRTATLFTRKFRLPGGMP